jgi:hypothetical protein
VYTQHICIWVWCCTSLTHTHTTPRPARQPTKHSHSIRQFGVGGERDLEGDLGAACMCAGTGEKYVREGSCVGGAVVLRAVQAEAHPMPFRRHANCCTAGAWLRCELICMRGWVPAGACDGVGSKLWRAWPA